MAELKGECFLKLAPLSQQGLVAWRVSLVMSELSMRWEYFWKGGAAGISDLIVFLCQFCPGGSLPVRANTLC